MAASAASVPLPPNNNNNNNNTYYTAEKLLHKATGINLSPAAQFKALMSNGSFNENELSAADIPAPTQVRPEDLPEDYVFRTGQNGPYNKNGSRRLLRSLDMKKPIEIVSANVLRERAIKEGKSENEASKIFERANAMTNAELKNAVAKMGNATSLNDQAKIQILQLRARVDQALNDAEQMTNAERKAELDRVGRNTLEGKAIISIQKVENKLASAKTNNAKENVKNAVAAAVVTEAVAEFSVFNPSTWGAFFSRPSSGSSSGSSSSNNKPSSFSSMSQNDQNRTVEGWGNATSEKARNEINAAQAEAAAEEEANPYNSNKDGGRRRKATRKGRKGRKSRKATRKAHKSRKAHRTRRR